MEKKELKVISKEILPIIYYGSYYSHINEKLQENGYDEDTETIKVDVNVYWKSKPEDNFPVSIMLCGFVSWREHRPFLIYYNEKTNYWKFGMVNGSSRTCNDLFDINDWGECPELIKEVYCESGMESLYEQVVHKDSVLGEHEGPIVREKD